MSEAPPPPAGGSDQPFYDDLTPYGKWVQAAGSGWVWAPYNVEADWRPYQVGHWVFTDYGWTWASDEPYGWAVYHYGRWDRDSRYGWVWVPGPEWGPAWVAWHEGGGYVGWAPLPSQVRVQVGIGLDWGGVNVSLEPASWCFVNARNLVDPGLRGRIEPPSRNGSLIRVTQNITNYTYINNRVVNQGVRVDSIGRAVGHAIPHYRIAESESAEATRGGKVRGQDFVVFRPDPRHGRGSQGRPDPPGHDPDNHQRDFRGGPPQQEPPADEARQAPGTQASSPSEPPATNTAQENQGHGRPQRESRGRKFFDSLRGKPADHRAPQGGATSQSPAPTSNAAGGPANPPAQSATAPGSKAGSTASPAATAPAGGDGPAKPQPAKFNGRGPKNAPPKRGKPKPEGSKPAGTENDKSQQQGSSSNP